MEHALDLLCYIFRTWSSLCSYCVMFSSCGGTAHGTRSGVIVLHFLRVERALSLLCYIFRMCRACAWNAIWHYCVISSACGGPARGTHSVVIVLYFSTC